MSAPTANRPHCPASHAVARTASLLQNPLNGGMPEREAAAMRKTTKVSFLLCLSPPMPLTYLVPVAWMSTPAAMKRHALNIAWDVRWKRPAERPWAKFEERPVMPRAIIMYPICEAVE